MATITMDTSEYEALQKNIKLLEEAKDREKQLTDKINRLQAEKIEALENSANKVTIITENRTIEEVYAKKSEQQIAQALLNMRNTDPRFRGSFANMIVKECFEKSTIINPEVNTKSIVLKDLDEYLVEYKKEYLQKLSKETEDKLKKYEELVPKYAQLREEFKSYEDVKNLRDEFSGLYTNLQKEHTELKLQYSTLTSTAESIIGSVKPVFGWRTVSKTQLEVLDHFLNKFKSK